MTVGISFVYHFIDGCSMTVRLEELLCPEFRSRIHKFIAISGGVLAVESPEEGIIHVV